jgi:V8-like Glu-specific endopeptidase
VVEVFLVQAPLLQDPQTMEVEAASKLPLKQGQMVAKRVHQIGYRVRTKDNKFDDWVSRAVLRLLQPPWFEHRYNTISFYHCQTEHQYDDYF